MRLSKTQSRSALNKAVVETHGAAEYKSLTAAEATLPATIRHTRVLLERLASVASIPRGGRLLEIGSGCGERLLALTHCGWNCVGLEFTPEAIATGVALAETFGLKPLVAGGDARWMPFADGSFDIVIANSVVEHIPSIDRVFEEVHRILRPGGAFWFSTASAMCPSQGEIRGFPLFGWYPHALKLRIIDWAKTERPDLVGHTKYPAVNWFTDQSANRMLRAAGYRRILDRWDIRLESEGGKWYQMALRIVRWNGFTRRLANA